MKLHYVPSDQLRVVSGVELAYASIGSTLLQSNEPRALDTGRPSQDIPGGNQVPSRDIAGYTQAAWDAHERLTLVAGGRIDYNQAGSRRGYGVVFNPRLAAVFQPGAWVFKAIHAQAFLDPPNFQRFQTEGSRRLPNPGLVPRASAKHRAGRRLATESRGQRRGGLVRCQLQRHRRDSAGGQLRRRERHRPLRRRRRGHL